MSAIYGNGKAGARLRRKRGVSPIIATILLVAITVVLAAVLYVLVSGLTSHGATTPQTLQFGSATQTGSGTTWFDTLGLLPSNGLTTSMFGLKIVPIAGGTMPTGAIPATCSALLGTTTAPTTTTCTGVTNDWYGVVVNSGGAPVAIYGGATAGWTYASGTTTIALNDGYSLIVVTASSISGTGATINAFSTGSASVSGQGSL